MYGEGGGIHDGRIHGVIHSTLSIARSQLYASRPACSMDVHPFIFVVFYCLFSVVVAVVFSHYFVFRPNI